MPVAPVLSAVGRQDYQHDERSRNDPLPSIYIDAAIGRCISKDTPPAGDCSLASATLPRSQFKEKHMKSIVRSALAAVAAGVALAGCASYDYGSGYTYAQPYNGYNYGYYGYDSGPYSYDYGPYYYGPSGYVGPSVGFDFTYRDRDRGNYDRNYNRHRDGDSRYDNGYRRGDNNQWRGDQSRSRSAAPYPSGPDDPWGGTNKPNDRNSQQ